MKRILTITLNPTVDKSTCIDKLVPEKKLRCESPKFEPGGGGINVSRALSRLGFASEAFFPSGGRTGKLLQELLEHENIAHNSFEVNAGTRENFIVVESSTNQQFRFGMPGSEISTAEQAGMIAKISDLDPFPEIIVISGSLPPGMEPAFLKEIINVCKLRNALIIADTSGEALQQVVDLGVYLLKPNLGELAKLVGLESLDNDAADDAARELISRGSAEVVVVSLGPQGACLVTKDKSEYLPAPAVKKLSTVGAGDSMVAGMVSVLAKGGSFSEMVRMGVACGSAATMNSGTQLFKTEDAMRLFEWLTRNVPA